MNAHLSKIEDIHAIAAGCSGGVMDSRASVFQECQDRLHGRRVQRVACAGSAPLDGVPGASPSLSQHKRSCPVKDQ